MLVAIVGLAEKALSVVILCVLIEEFDCKYEWFDCCVV